MKKLVYTLVLLFTISTTYYGCREKKENKVEEAIEEAGDAVEDAADEVQDATE